MSTTYAVNGRPITVDDFQSTSVAVQNTGTEVLFIEPLGRQVPVGQTVTVPGWSTRRTRVRTAGQNGTAVVTLTAGTPAAAPGPGGVTFDPGPAASVSLSISGGTWYSNEGLTTAVSFPVSLVAPTVLYPAAAGSITVTAVVGGTTQVRGMNVNEGSAEGFTWVPSTDAERAAAGVSAGTGTYAGVRTLARISSFGAPAVVTSHSLWPDGQSNGTITEGNYRTRYRVTFAATDLVMVFVNAWSSEVTPYTVVDDVTVRAGLELADGTTWPVYFGGRREAICGPGGFLVSDPIPVTVAAGDVIYARCHPKVTSGGKWVTTMPRRTNWGEGGSTTTDATDMTLTGTIGTASVFLFSPSLILGTTSTMNPKTIAIVGDSIADGTGDSSNVGDYYLGYIERALGGTYGMIRISNPGETAADFLVAGGIAARSRLFATATHAVCEYGINDLNVAGPVTLAALKARLVSIWTIFAARGIPIWQCTLTPRTTSTDAWATTANQTLALVGGEEQERTDINDWIRTTPAPLSGYFEVADQLETARNSGIWKPLYTADGTHPSPTGYTAAAAIIPTSVFT